ncbi:MAG TPA: hypothetical protein VNA12_03945 [Mycobacteriales bacterium]|nr:hypothetical protein [Mycobacteriales bacterium]
MTVALDAMGGDHGPAAVVDGALLVADARPEVEVVLVGAPDVLAACLAERGVAGRLDVVPARQVVEMTEDPARAVRAKRDASVRVAARLVRDGRAAATVTVGPTGAALAAAVFTLGRLPGVTRPGLAVVVPTPGGDLVLLDAGATVDCRPDLLAQLALAGAAFARARLGVDDPRVGLLNVGSEQGKGDLLRREAADLLGRLPINYVGNVEGNHVAEGGRADVVVTDGFTGNVVVKCLEGAARSRPADDAADPDTGGGGVLLGVDGVAVVGHAGSSPSAVAHCICAAADAAATGLVDRVRAALADLVARRLADPDVGAVAP